MNKLAQLLFIFVISAMVFIVHLYAGPMFSSPIRTKMIVVKPALEHAAKKPRKVKKPRKRKLTQREKMRQILARRLSDCDGEPDWDFIELKKS